MKNQLTPTATCRITPTRTQDGKPILKVAVFTPGAVDWRTYTHDPDTPLDAVVRSALKSLGLASAWVWGALDHPPEGRDESPTTDTDRTRRKG